jgi:hypothetical protein
MELEFAIMSRAADGACTWVLVDVVSAVDGVDVE